MMVVDVRFSQSDYIRYLWRAISASSQTEASKVRVLKYLIKNAEFLKDDAELLIDNAINDHLVINTIVQSTAKSVKDSLRIPNLEEISINENSHDWYCYECHKSDENLKECTKCLRTFHEKCFRENPDKSNNDVSFPTNKHHVRKLSNNEQNNKKSNDNERSRRQGRRPGSVNNNNRKSQDEIEIQEITSNDDSDSDEDFRREKKFKFDDDDVIFMGQCRPPSRRHNNSLKSENDINDDDNNGDVETEKTLCSRCRIMKKSQSRDPPYMSREEINYLLKFIHNVAKKWLSSDTFSPVQSSKSWAMPSKQHVEIFSKLCFKYPMSIAVIENKLKNQKYSSLTEFQCDYNDLVHCIGIFFGCDSTEYECALCLLKDSFYELSEMRQCHYCYRYSNEKLQSDWFCKPCIPRHELVFAKCSGWPYWPAKVLRVNNNEYDVRFFGYPYKRFICKANNIKPIDTDLKELKIKDSKSFQIALKELQRHQQLLSSHPEQFSVLNVSDDTRRSLQKSRKQQEQQQSNDVSTIVSGANSESGRTSNRRKRGLTIDSRPEYIYYDDGKSTSNNKKSNLRPRSKSVHFAEFVSDIETQNEREKNTKTHQMSASSSNQESQVSSSQDFDENTLENFREQIMKTKNLLATRKLAIELFKREIERHHAKIEELIEKHRNEILEIKRKKKSK